MSFLIYKGTRSFHLLFSSELQPSNNGREGCEGVRHVNQPHARPGRVGAPAERCRIRVHRRGPHQQERALLHYNPVTKKISVLVHHGQVHQQWPTPPAGSAGGQGTSTTSQLSRNAIMDVEAVSASVNNNHLMKGNRRISQ
jgi:hypothetical protein